jgi:soluble lytic murein transglycosylase-like protein
MHESRYYRTQIEDAAKRSELDPDLVEAVVRVESSGLPHAYRYEPAFYDRYLADDPTYNTQSPRRVSASYGLMQVMYSTAVKHGFGGPPEALFMPVVGIAYGCRVLSFNLTRCHNDLDLALAAYNGGLRRAKHPLAPDLARYVEKVKSVLATIKKERP